MPNSHCTNSTKLTNCQHCKYSHNIITCECVYFCSDCYYCSDLQFSTNCVFCHGTWETDPRHYQAFNKEVTRERFLEIWEFVGNTIPKGTKFSNLTRKQYNGLKELPEFDEKVFAHISKRDFFLIPLNTQDSEIDDAITLLNENGYYVVREK